METYGLFNPSQHGFWFWRSCIRRPHRTAELLANGGNVEILYMNFAKEFGKIGFYITLKKLNSIGVTGKVGRLVYSFLTQRTQVFLVNSSGSRLPEVKSQGSVLGPLLFLILLGDCKGLSVNLRRWHQNRQPDHVSRRWGKSANRPGYIVFMDNTKQRETEWGQIWMPLLWPQTYTSRYHSIPC